MPIASASAAHQVLAQKACFRLVLQAFPVDVFFLIIAQMNGGLRHPSGVWD
jgi:hypothetical protein